MELCPKNVNTKKRLFCGTSIFLSKFLLSFFTSQILNSFYPDKTYSVLSCLPSPALRDCRHCIILGIFLSRSVIPDDIRLKDQNADMLLSSANISHFCRFLEWTGFIFWTGFSLRLTPNLDRVGSPFSWKGISSPTPKFFIFWNPILKPYFETLFWNPNRS